MTRASSSSPPPPAWTPASPTSRRSSSRSPASSTASPTTTSTTSGWCRNEAERLPRLQHPFQRLLRRRPQRRQVAHLPAGPRRGLAVEVELDLGKAAGGGPIGLAVLPEVAQEVRHGGGAQELGRAQGEAGDGPELLLELAGDAGVEGEVAGVVRARRQLVDQQPAVAGQEHLDAEHAHDSQLFEDAAG